MNVLHLEKAASGGQILVTDYIENYLGFPGGILRYEFSEKMRIQVEDFHRDKGTISTSSGQLRIRSALHKGAYNVTFIRQW